LDEKAVRFVWDLQEQASAHTDDKVKVLLTLSASLSTGVLVITRGTDATVPWTYGIAAFACAAYLCLAGLGVRTYWSPTPTKRDEGGDWVRDLYSCYLGNSEAQVLRVGLLRGARRWFLVGFVLVGLAGVTARRRPDQAVAVLSEIGSSAGSLAADVSALRGASGTADSVATELRRLRLAVDRLVTVTESTSGGRSRRR
jgi:hypothetical protein